MTTPKRMGNGLPEILLSAWKPVTHLFLLLTIFSAGILSAFEPPVPKPFSESNDASEPTAPAADIKAPLYTSKGEHKEAQELLGAINRLQSPNSPAREVQDYHLALKAAQDLKTKIDAGHPSKNQYMKTLVQATILIPTKYSAEFCLLIAKYVLKTPDMLSSVMPVLSPKERNLFSRRLWVGCRQAAVERIDDPENFKNQSMVFESIKVYL